MMFKAVVLSYAHNVWFRAAAVGQSVFAQQYTKCPVEVEQQNLNDIVVNGEDQKEAQKEALAVSLRTGSDVAKHWGLAQPDGIALITSLFIKKTLLWPQALGQGGRQMIAC